MKGRKFTLIEVVIATLILSIAAVITVGMLNRSVSNTFDAESRWANSHLLSLGAEHYLLWGQEVDFPSELLPGGIAIECETYEYEDEFADETLELNTEWFPMNYHIRLFRDGELIDELKVTKLVKEDEL
jgi:Tfp pilus assembly protein PilE